MIILKTLRWHNVFSYGKDNVIELDRHQVVQLVGKNGHGKSSIALVLEEVLFNKNSKGIKKADILNRYVKDKSYSIELVFEQDGSTYEIKTNRGSSQTVSFYKDGDNISAHTATATFKLIEDTLGIDHKAFSQLVYLASSGALEFLTSTDTTRKKFLVDLLNLTKYMNAFEHFKAVAKQVSDDVLALQTKIKTTESWLEKHSKEDLTEKPTIGIPVWEDKPEVELAETTKLLNDIVKNNKKISQNEVYKQQLSSIPVEDLTAPTPIIESDKPYLTDLGSARLTVKNADTFIKSISALKDTCPTCKQPINKDILAELMSQQEDIKNAAQAAITRLNQKIDEIGKLSKETERVAKLKNDWETYHSLIDNSLPTEPYDEEGLKDKVNELNKVISHRKKELDTALAEYEKVAAHNSRIKVILEQMQEMRNSLEIYTTELSGISFRLNILQILQKTFSTNGLIAYKIECLVKDLEILANEYLAELSDGRFQLTFKIAGGDKLNVVISDNGNDIDILALSGGERARVNTATLLAIRKLMQSLSSVRINLLILDETIDSLDVDGKEKLVEILVKEQELNTFIVSHGFTHPLLEKISVIKEQNISRLE